MEVLTELVSDMEYTILLENVMITAKQLAKQFDGNEERVEYYFLALLQMALLEDADENLIEWTYLKSRLEEVCLEDLSTTERKTSEKAEKSILSEEVASIERSINIAKKYAVEDYAEEVTAVHLLEAILHEPTDFVKEFIREALEVIHLSEEEEKELARLTGEMKR